MDQVKAHQQTREQGVIDHKAQKELQFGILVAWEI